MHLAGVSPAHTPRSTAAGAVGDFVELDSALAEQARFTWLGNVDLSILAGFLCAESDVRSSVVGGVANAAGGAQEPAINVVDDERHEMLPPSRLVMNNA